MSSQALSTAFLVLCSLLLYQLALIFAPFFTPILWALILVRLFYPLYQYLTRQLRGQTTVSAALSTLSVTFIAVLPVAYLAFLAVTAVFVVTPGSTTAVVVRNTLAAGHRAGLSAAVGAAAANSTHATLAGLGLWVLVGRWPALLDAIRAAGAAYLAWLGLQSLMRGLRPGPSRLAAPSAVQPRAHRSSFFEGLTVNLLNPAIISFYVAVVPTFMPPSPPRGYFALLAGSHVSMALVCHSGWVYAFHSLRQIFARPLVRRTLELLTAAAMLWLGWRVLSQL